MRLSLALAGLACIAADVPNAAPVHVGGRVIADRDGGLTFGWPGTYFESRVEGSGFRLRFEAPAEHLRLLVDGQQKAVFEKPGSVDIVFGGLPSGQHRLRLEKLTESQSGGGRFIGFSPVAGGRALSPLPKARRIEFIGDSYTVGYGNRSTKRECTRDQVHDLTDTQQAFGPIVARKLDADYRVNAYSGFGIVRNYGGSSAELSLPAIYPRLKPDVPPNANNNPDNWQPQLVVINLGTNDFSTPLKSGERWKNDAELRADYRNRYLRFLVGLHAAYPKAKFLLMGSEAFFQDVRQVASLARLSKLPVREMRFGNLDLMGCDWHPSLADHRLLAGQVEKEIAAIKPW
jgi:lysophospholipase L1-like esterase